MELQVGNTRKNEYQKLEEALINGLEISRLPWGIHQFVRRNTRKIENRWSPPTDFKAANPLIRFQTIYKYMPISNTVFDDIRLIIRKLQLSAHHHLANKIHDDLHRYVNNLRITQSLPMISWSPDSTIKNVNKNNSHCEALRRDASHFTSSYVTIIRYNTSIV